METHTTNDSPLMTPAAVSTLLGISKPQLQRMRSRNTGPDFYRIGRRLIRYSSASVTAWTLVPHGGDYGVRGADF